MAPNNEVNLVNVTKEKIKKWINFIRIPALVNLIFKSKKEALDSAPKAESNWLRLGLEKTWIYFIPLPVVIAICIGKDALINLINIFSYGIAILPLALIGIYLWRKIK